MSVSISLSTSTSIITLRVVTRSCASVSVAREKGSPIWLKQRFFLRACVDCGQDCWRYRCPGCKKIRQAAILRGEVPAPPPEYIARGLNRQARKTLPEGFKRVDVGGARRILDTRRGQLIDEAYDPDGNLIVPK